MKQLNTTTLFGWMTWRIENDICYGCKNWNLLSEPFQK